MAVSNRVTTGWPGVRAKVGAEARRGGGEGDVGRVVCGMLRVGHGLGDKALCGAAAWRGRSNRDPLVQCESPRRMAGWVPASTAWYERRLACPAQAGVPLGDAEFLAQPYLGRSEVSAGCAGRIAMAAKCRESVVDRMLHSCLWLHGASGMLALGVGRMGRRRGRRSGSTRPN